MFKLLGPYTLGLLIVTVLIRLYGMLEFPLHDPTEARYAEISRLILETGQWIMPPFNYDVPFWGKPPLSFWLTAISFKLFGVNEFSARIPVFFFAGVVLWLTFHFARRIQTAESAWLSTIILVTTPSFFIASGAVMTDMVLTACVSLSMISFWKVISNDILSETKTWAYLFFVGLGLGLLVKGPIIGILVMLPVFAWVAISGQWSVAWQKIPWIRGTALMLLIAVPWYVLAEIESPGFINYFLVGEHFYRFIDSGWKGDLYGGAHSSYRGKIWLLWFLVCLPWSLILLGTIFSWMLNKNTINKPKNYFGQPRFLYLLFWAITPMVFFTFSRNILYTYVLPGLPALAILTADLLSLRFNIQSALKSKWLIVGYLTPLVGLVFFLLDPALLSFEKNQKALYELYEKTRNSETSGLYYMNERLYSIDFYSRGKSQKIESHLQPYKVLSNNDREDFVIMQEKYSTAIAPEMQQAFQPVGKFRKYLLLQEMNPK